jgi:glutathione synthase
MMMKKILFVTDPLKTFKTTKDSTFAMMRECVKRGFEIAACTPADLFWKTGQGVCARVVFIKLTGEAQNWFEAAAVQLVNVGEMSATLMRKDPPFDTEYLYATHLLEQAEREGAQVFNRPRALRDHSEKLAIMEFASLITPTLVARDLPELRAFHQTHQDIILKPLDGMGGKGIFRVGPDALNLGSILETLTQNGQQTVMAQKYLTAITQGDKRVLLINGKPIPHVLARVPQGTEIRGNLAAGGKGVVQALSERDLEIANQIGPILAKRGLLLVGLDVIGDCLTEINVTSPTGFQEITQQTGFDVAKVFVDALETHFYEDLRKH